MTNSQNNSERKRREFVDRDEETTRFRAFLADGRKAVFAIYGDGGIGKSSLLDRLKHDCLADDVLRMEFVWSETQQFDYLMMMRKIRDFLGPSDFRNFTLMVNAYYDPAVRMSLDLASNSRIDVASGLSVEGASIVGDIAGVMVKDCMIVVPRLDGGVSEHERRMKLTEQFLLDLDMALAQRRLVLFLDAVEKMSKETATWLGNEIIGAIRDQRVRNVIVVQSGKENPRFDRETALIVDEAELKPLGRSDIAIYLSRRGIPPLEVPSLAALLWITTKGHPMDVASTVDILERLVERELN